jgi:hypothetical protein
MLDMKPMRTWQIMLSQLLLTVAATVCLVFAIHFPDVTRRPTPPPTNVLFLLLLSVAVGAITFALVGVRSTKAHTGIVVWSSLILWLLGCYALIFVWINTFGT